MLIGKNIILRPLKIDDLEKVNEWRNNLELIKMTQGIRFPKTIEMDRDWFENALKDKSNNNIYFGIDEIEKNEFIGIIQLTNIDYISGTCVIGISIGDKSKRGKGYSMEAQKLLYEYAFKMLNIRKITSYVAVYNNISIKMFEKGGFKEEGKLQKHIFIDGKYHDVVILSLFRENFKIINSY